LNERGITDFASRPNGGLIVVGPPSSVANYRDLIVSLGARYHLPAVYATLAFVGNGALISYGGDQIDQFRRAASYVDHILKGEKPADLPVQAPTKFKLVINLKTAKSLGLTIPTTLLATAAVVLTEMAGTVHSLPDRTMPFKKVSSVPLPNFVRIRLAATGRMTGSFSDGR
jgi:putative tryptophan/tyrosine transport system substrate-binding protein